MEMKTIFNWKLYYQVHADPSKFSFVNETETLSTLEKYDIEIENRETENPGENRFDIWFI